MKTRIAINGFGRIGRMVLRALWESKHPNLEVVAINDLGSIESNAHLFAFDSIHGRFGGEVKISNEAMDIGLGPIKILNESHPENLPWKSMNIDLVMECSGRFTKREEAAKHLDAGARRVLISAPGENADLTVVYGVNHKLIQDNHKIISNASCTTNCLAPVASVLQESIGIEMGYMTTIHAYTGDQRLVDTLHSDLRRARAAATSMIPSSTGAAKALGLVIPSLAGKLDGTAIRVPTPNVSVVDLTFLSARPTNVDEINVAIQEAARGDLKGVLGVASQPLVSIDFNHDPHSSVFDLTQTQVVQKKFCRVLSWYDNEWGFANRMCDVASYMGAAGL
jgi:glyceraldehyde 3-phosphate dehydrogenase